MSQPLSQVLLTIPTALQDEIITNSGLKLYLDPTYSKEWHASVTATIADLPIKVSKKDKKILDQLSIGDEVCISYRVVADFEFKGDGAQFMPITEENEYVKEFRNGRGDWIRIYALQKRRGITDIPLWVGFLQDKYGEVVSGTQGTEREVSRWQAQFPFGKTDIYSFNNFFEYNKQDYWKCDLTEIFAKRANGHLVAVGDRIICRPIDEEVPAELLQAIQHHESVKIRYQDRAEILTGGKEKGFKKGQIIGFNPQFLERYEFFNKQYYLINQNRVLGIWN